MASVATATAPAEPAFAERPSKTIHVVYLKEGVQSEYVIRMFAQICADHGLDVTNVTANELTAKLSKADSGKAGKMELTMKCGAHPVKGNMMAIEYKTFAVEKGLKILGIALLALVVVAATVAVVVAAKGDGGHHHHGGGGGCFGGGGFGGGGGGGHRHHHHTTSVIVWDSYGWGGPYYRGGRYRHSRTRRRRRRAAALGGAYMYARHTTTGAGAVTPVRQAAAFDTRDQFFGYFFENVNRFLFNAGVARVPDEVALVAAANSGRPLALGVPAAGEVGGFDSDVYVVHVPPESCLGAPTPAAYPTLQVDVLADADLKVKLAKISKPGRRKTVVGAELGSHQYAMAVGPGRKINLEPGHWIITVSRRAFTGPAKYRIGAVLFEDTEKSRVNGSLFGSFSSRPVEADLDGSGGADDGWELIEEAGAVGSSSGSGGGGAAAPTVAAAAPGPPPAYDEGERVLTQATNLLEVPAAELTNELAARGVPGPFPVKDHRQLAALLFPLLPPPPPSPTAPSAPPEPEPDPTAAPIASDAAGSTDEVGDPDALVCPITLELMSDPVFTADGHTYDRKSIEEWFARSDTSPLTGLKLPHKALVPNVNLRHVITQYLMSRPAGRSVPVASAPTPASAPTDIRRSPSGELSAAMGISKADARLLIDQGVMGP